MRGNSPVPGEFPAQRPVTMSFDVFFDLRLNKRLSKQSWGRWFETLSCPLWRHCNDNPLDQHWLDIEPTHLCPIDVISMLMQWSLLSGLPPVYRQTITWTSMDILWIGPLSMKYCLSKKMHSEILSNTEISLLCWYVLKKYKNVFPCYVICPPWNGKGNRGNPVWTHCPLGDGVAILN